MDKDKLYRNSHFVVCCLPMLQANLCPWSVENMVCTLERKRVLSSLE